ncbi:MAG TPA: winged helix-turn-helix domain-containing protein [Streptosporangiaceae bacterium]|nr:winged helix-turn-helix domain-containing protein [Streptosporangiaceae bacterium]
MSKIDPTGKLPPYRQLAAIVAGRIESGEYPRGSRLPSEADFMEEFELGRSTVRRAMAWLREQGLAETVPTRGTYAAE